MKIEKTFYHLLSYNNVKDDDINTATAYKTVQHGASVDRTAPAALPLSFGVVRK